MRSANRDRGSVSIEAVIAVPVLMLTIAACMQVALLFFARSIALAAAQEGVRAARAEHASRVAAGPVAQRYAANTAGGFLSSISASASGDATTIRVRVRGQALSLVPFLPSIGVEAEAAGVIERFTTPSGGRP